MLNDLSSKRQRCQRADCVVSSANRGVSLCDGLTDRRKKINANRSACKRGETFVSIMYMIPKVLMRLACWKLGLCRATLNPVSPKWFHPITGYPIDGLENTKLHSLGAPDALPSLSTSHRAHTTRSHDMRKP